MQTVVFSLSRLLEMGNITRPWSTSLSVIFTVFQMINGNSFLWVPYRLKQGEESLDNLIIKPGLYPGLIGSVWSTGGS